RLNEWYTLKKVDSRVRGILEFTNVGPNKPAYDRAIKVRINEVNLQTNVWFDNSPAGMGPRPVNVNHTSLPLWVESTSADSSWRDSASDERVEALRKYLEENGW